ncbi:MAG: membrane protein [Thermodesulfobacteriota bacterium]|nr:MAG: membrane protein [Thermodesulfobacteriota bacterium]
MNDSLSTVLTYVMIPVVVTIIGGIIAAYKSPGEKTRITVQHFAAGVVFAAVALELLPELVTNLKLLPLIIGFSSGVALMLIVRKVSKKIEGAGGSGGLVIASGVDVFIDGLLIGVSFDVGLKAGIIITIALAIELLFLALSVASTLAKEGKSKLRIIGTTIALSLLVLIGATIGGTLLQGIHSSGLEGIIAFAVAALLYLVTEELLVEAHKENKDSAFATTMFFVGFLIVLILESLA